ncbi:MAG: argininosuccinate lyase [bacterium]|nr:argininosuccinate lyase [bacterium]
MTTSGDKPWSGRFRSPTAPEADLYTASLPFDRRLYAQDIRGSVAHTRMLARQGIIGAGEAAAIEEGLHQIEEEIEAGTFPWRLELEDVHMNIEARLVEKIGPVGGKLPTGRSRNDQVALDMHLYLAEETRVIDERLCGLQAALLGQARANPGAILPGYTHLQRAQPVALAHHLLAYFFMLQRDRERLADARRRIEMVPLGAGALAGSSFALDPDSVARDLGFGRRYANSIDAVADRDFVVETLAACALIAVHLSRLGEELVLWSSSEFAFLEMADAYTTGSSMMPQKKNPVIGELMRAKAGRVTGALVTLLTVLKGLPLAYNSDLQEDKEATFDALDTVKASLAIATAAITTSSFNATRMRQAVATGYLEATDVADYLAARGVPFRKAHLATGRAVALAASRGVGLKSLPLDDLRELHPAFDAGVYALLTPEAALTRRASPMGTGPEEIRRQLDLAETLLAASPGTVDWVAVSQSPLPARPPR